MATGDGTVKNTESTARDHLANERTFLAWFRTSLALVGFGVLFERLMANESWFLTEAMVLSSICGGAIMLSYATIRYQRVARALRRGEFVIASTSLLFIGWVGVALALALAVALWWRP